MADRVEPLSNEAVRNLDEVGRALELYTLSATDFNSRVDVEHLEDFKSLSEYYDQLTNKLRP